jgi:hypothetical protein
MRAANPVIVRPSSADVQAQIKVRDRPCLSSPPMALEQFGEELWLARARLSFLGVPAGRVMTVARLGDGALWVHSAAPLDDELRRALKDLGDVRWVVAPNKLHGYVSMAEYRTAFPHARLVGGPGLAERRPKLGLDATLGETIDPEWSPALEQTTLRGHRWVTEVLFHHRPSRTLITGDACWNIAPGDPLRVRLWAGRRQGVGPARPFRLGFGDKAAARESVREVLAWEPERLVCGHGEPVAAGAREVFADAYAFLG